MSQLIRSTPVATRPPATKSAPSTPIAQKAVDATPLGSWKHPKFDEITRRQYATNFDESNVKAILANAGLLFLSAAAPSISENVVVLRALSTPLSGFIHRIPYSDWLILAIRLLFVTNIVNAILPLFRRYYPDTIADIALTPSQRHAMRLGPGSETPDTPGSAYASPNYVTPPRYQKSTPRTNSSRIGDRGSHSPFTDNPRASLAKSTSNSPFSPGNGSPLFHKAVEGSVTRRMSFGGSPLGNSLFDTSSSSATPGTPTPSTGKASVGLNNKWLYEKRRDSPRRGLFN